MVEQSSAGTNLAALRRCIDPAAGIFAVLLTNRVHPTRAGGSLERITALRTRFHNTVWAALAPSGGSTAEPALST